jgi:hypothetical protein
VGDGSRRLDLAHVALTVLDGQREKLEPLSLQQGGRGVGIQPPAQ